MTFHKRFRGYERSPEFFFIDDATRSSYVLVVFRGGTKNAKFQQADSWEGRPYTTGVSHEQFSKLYKIPRHHYYYYY